MQGGNFQSMVLDDSSLLMLRGDVTYFKEGLAGSHEFQAGFLALPRNQYDTFNNYLDNGFILEERQQIAINNPAAGTVPFHRRYVTGDLSLQTAGGRDRDVGLYVADSWKPTTRLTASLGLRTDFVHRFDTVRNQPRGSSREVAPRLGVSYLLTKDAKNVLRASYGRSHRQLMGGRDPLAAFGGSNTAALRDTYDVNGNGSFSAERATPATRGQRSADQGVRTVNRHLIDRFRGVQSAGDPDPLPLPDPGRGSGRAPSGPHSRAQGRQGPLLRVLPQRTEPVVQSVYLPDSHDVAGGSGVPDFR